MRRITARSRPRRANPRTALGALAVLLAIAAAAGCGGCGDDAPSAAAATKPPGQPEIEFISPRNGAVQRDMAVVAKVDVRNFHLAPSHFDGEPLLGEGYIRFSLHRVPDCVDPVKLERAVKSPIGKGRLFGASFDTAKYAGPNGILGRRIGSTGSYSPATRPEIFYANLRPGFYRLVATLAANDGVTTPTHDVTNFQILEKPNHEIADCVGGKISSAKAAAAAAD
jgi:hypothetical protein